MGSLQLGENIFYDETDGRLVVTIILINPDLTKRAAVVLDFTGQEEKLAQLDRYVEPIDINGDMATFFSLKYWAENRTIPAQIKIIGFFSLGSLLDRILPYLYSRFSFVRDANPLRRG